MEDRLVFNTFGVA